MKQFSQRIDIVNGSESLKTDVWRVQVNTIEILIINVEERAGEG